MTLRSTAALALGILIAACSSPEPTSPAATASLAGTWECGGSLSPGSGGLNLVWVWELSEDGTLTVTGPDDVVHEGTWSAEAGTGLASVEGDEANAFVIEGDRLVFESFECARSG